MGAHPLYVALSQRGLLDPIEPAYNQSRRLKLTASTFSRLWIIMLAVLVTVPTVSQNSLHPLSTSSITARHLLDFMVEGKITDSDALTICLDATRSGLSVPHLHLSPRFTPNALPVATLPVLSWLETGTEYCWPAYPVAF